MDFELLIFEIERESISDPRNPKHYNRDLVNEYWSEITELVKLEGIWLKR